jgi:hypothetical protein
LGERSSVLGSTTSASIPYLSFSSWAAARATGTIYEKAIIIIMSEPSFAILAFPVYIGNQVKIVCKYHIIRAPDASFKNVHEIVYDASSENVHIPISNI